MGVSLGTSTLERRRVRPSQLTFEIHVRNEFILLFYGKDLLYGLGIFHKKVSNLHVFPCETPCTEILVTYNKNHRRVMCVRDPVGGPPLYRVSFTVPLLKVFWKTKGRDPC